MEKEINKVIRIKAKVIKVYVLDTSVLDDILITSNELIHKQLSISDFRKQPKVEELRKIIEPAYIKIAEIIKLFTNNPEHLNIKSENLISLSIINSPTFGLLEVKVSVTKDNKIIGRYIIKFYPKDNNTLVTRTINKPIKLVGNDVVKEAFDYFIKL